MVGIERAKIFENKRYERGILPDDDNTCGDKKPFFGG